MTNSELDRALLALVTSAAEPMTARDMYSILRLDDPDLPAAGVAHRLWRLAAAGVVSVRADLKIVLEAQ